MLFRSPRRFGIAFGVDELVAVALRGRDTGIGCFRKRRRGGERPSIMARVGEHGHAGIGRSRTERAAGIHRTEGFERARPEERRAGYEFVSPVSYWWTRYH